MSGTIISRSPDANGGWAAVFFPPPPRRAAPVPAARPATRELTDADVGLAPAAPPRAAAPNYGLPPGFELDAMPGADDWRVPSGRASPNVPSFAPSRPFEIVAPASPNGGVDDWVVPAASGGSRVPAFDPYAEFEVVSPAPTANRFGLPPGFELDPMPAAAAPATGVDDWFVPNAPEAPSRFGVNMAEGFRGTIAGEAVERTRSGQVALNQVDQADRALGWASRNGVDVIPEQVDGQPSPFAGIPIAQLQQLRDRALLEGGRRADVYRTETLPARRAEEATLPPISGPIEAATALAGQLVGSMGSPESFVGPAGARLGRVGSEGLGAYVGRQAVESGAPNALVAGAADLPVQGGQVERGERVAYDPVDTALAAALGGVIGTGIPVGLDQARAFRGWLAGRRGTPDVDPASVTPADLVQWRDEDVRRAAEANGITDPADPRTAQLESRLDPRRSAEADRAAVPPAVTQADIRTAREAVEAGADPAAVAPPARQPVPDTIALPDQSGDIPRVTTADGARISEPPLRGTADPNAVPFDPVRLRSEDGAAREAFDLADSQRQRVTDPGIQDSQPGGAPRAPSPREAEITRQLAQLEQQIGRLERNVTSDAHQVQLERLQARQATLVQEAQQLRAGGPTARQRQDFTARAGSPRNPEYPRGARDPVATGPAQTYRHTPRDPNVEFPGAERSSPPSGRTPFPDQPPDVQPPARDAAPQVGRDPPPVIDGQFEDVTSPAGRLKTVAALRRAGVPEADIRALSPEQRAARARAISQENPDAGRGADGPGAAGPEPGRGGPESGRDVPPRAGDGVPDGRGGQLGRGNVDRAASEGSDGPGVEQRDGTGDRPAGSEDAPVGDRGAGETLYANPVSPALLRRYIGEPVTELARGIRDSDANRNFQNIRRLVTASTRAGMRAMEDRYPDIPQIREMTEHLATDPGRGKLVRETFESAHESRSRSMSNRLRNIVGKDATDADWAALRDRLATGRGMDDVARRVRNLLDEQHDYLKKAGLDLGYVRGRYFPRAYDSQKILADREAFMADAEDFFRKRMGADRETARDAAGDWFARLAGVGDAGRGYADSPTGRFAKGRALPAQADTDLAKWMITDPREALARYFNSSSRSAEFVRRFGPNGEKAEDAFRAVLDAGARPKDVALMRTYFEAATGTMSGTKPGNLASTVSWIQTIGTLRLLPRAVLSSGVEALGLASRTGRPIDGLKGLVDTFRGIVGSKDMQAARDTAEILGIVGDTNADAMRFSQSGGAQPSSPIQQRIVTGMFRNTGLEALTRHQRIAATRVGQAWLGQLVRDVATDANTRKSAEYLLRDLGVDAADAARLHRWITRGDGVLTQTDLLAGSPEANLYRTAIARFVNEAIQNPQAVDKPALASAPVGRLAYGITSFMFAFARNMTLRTLNSAAEGVTGSGYTLADRARLAGPLAGLFFLGAAQFGVSEMREKLLNPSGKAERDPLVTDILNLDRAGAWGTLSPIMNLMTSAKYDRDPSSIVTGPFLSTMAADVGNMTLGLIPSAWGGPNSPNTNAAEHRAARSAAQLLLAPAAVAAMSLAPGGPAVQAAYGIGSAMVGSPMVVRGVADAVAGPRPPPRGARRPVNGRMTPQELRQGRLPGR